MTLLSCAGWQDWTTLSTYVLSEIRWIEMAPVTGDDGDAMLQQLLTELMQLQGHKEHQFLTWRTHERYGLFVLACACLHNTLVIMNFVQPVKAHIMAWTWLWYKTNPWHGQLGPGPCLYGIFSSVRPLHVSHSHGCLTNMHSRAGITERKSCTCMHPALGRAQVTWH